MTVQKIINSTRTTTQKKADGKTASDVSNTAYGGNAMSVFDGSATSGKIWLSQFEVGNYEYMIISKRPVR